MTRKDKTILKVSQLNDIIKIQLEEGFTKIWLEGEVSNFIKASSGHCYFVLKDSTAQIKAVLFRHYQQSFFTLPKDGDHIVLSGKLSLYSTRGDIQVLVHYIQPMGEGLLKQRFDALKAKLLAEGLFAQETKKTLITPIHKIAVITSSTGAVIHDILTVLKRRSPHIEIIIFPVQVQGSSATQEVCDALKQVQADQSVNAVIIARGGGSLEDLQPFNDEKLAYAIAKNKKTIISAVGHEVDFTICDFVADIRAPTPSAAAELVSFDVKTYITQLSHHHRQLIKGMEHIINNKTQYLDHLINRINHPKRQLQVIEERCMHLLLRLRTVIFHILNKSLNELEQLVNQQVANIINTIKNYETKYIELSNRLKLIIKQIIKQQQNILTEKIITLNSLNPLKVLERGYSIALKKNNIVIKSHEDVKTGDEIKLVLSEGHIVCKVIE